MTDASDEQGWTRANGTLARLSAALTNAARAPAPPLLFGLRLWASVCLTLYVAFWLELDNVFWAGTSASIVCQPQLGASLRKGLYRMIGTRLASLLAEGDGELDEEALDVVFEQVVAVLKPSLNKNPIGSMCQLLITSRNSGRKILAKTPRLLSRMLKSSSTKGSPRLTA
jgi:hypothetical protein